MKTIRKSQLLLPLSLALVLGACGKTEEPEASPESQHLLAFVPADTPYLMANLQALPEEVIDANFERLRPALEETQIQLTRLQARIEAGESPSGDDTVDRLVLAVLAELDGNLSREGLERLGWDTNQTGAMYGVGAFPVLRMALSDPAALRATIQRILQNAAVEAPESEFQGKSYWRVTADDTSEMPLAGYIAILDDHMPAGLYPIAAESDFLPGLLGLEMPANSDAAASLARLNAKHGYSPYFSGWLDLHRLADEFMDPEARTARTLMGMDAYDMDDLSPECVAETHAIIDNMPMVSGGFTEVSTDAMGYRLVAETPADLADRLVGLVARMPAARPLADHLAELSFGIKVGAARDFLREKAQAVFDAPYQCEHFADLNAQAEQVLTQVTQPLPPFVNNFRGIHLSIKDLVFAEGQDLPKDVRGHLAVHVEQPEMFVGMAQMFLPDLSELQLAPGSDPERVPEFLISIQGITAYAAMSDRAIGISLGQGEQDTLIEFLEMDAGEDGTLMSADYDSAALQELQQRHMPAPPADDPDDPLIALSEAWSEAAQATSDRTHVEVKFTPAGLVVDSQVSYKQAE